MSTMSTFYSRVRNSMKEEGGRYNITRTGWYLAIPSGEMAGTWRFFRDGPWVRFNWEPRINAVPRKFLSRKTRGLVEEAQRWELNILKPWDFLEDFDVFPWENVAVMLIQGGADPDEWRKHLQLPGAREQLQCAFNWWRHMTSWRDRARFSRQWASTKSLQESVPPKFKRVERWQELPMDFLRIITLLPKNWWEPRVRRQLWEVLVNRPDLVLLKNLGVRRARQLLSHPEFLVVEA